MNNVEFNAVGTERFMFRTKICGNTSKGMYTDKYVSDETLKKLVVDAIYDELIDIVNRFKGSSYDNLVSTDNPRLGVEPKLLHICVDWDEMFDGISFLPIRLRIDPNENLEEQIKQYDRLIDSIVFKIKQFMFEQSLIEPIEQYEILGYEEALTKEQYEQINKTPLN